MPLPFVPDAEFRVAIKERGLEIVIQSGNEHCQNTNPSAAAVAVAAVRAPAARANNLLAGTADMVAAAEEGLAQAAGSFNSVAEICNDELKRHITAKSQDFQFKTGKKDAECEDILGCNNSLDWWKEFQNLDPILARLVKICLSVQASSAALERVFSRASQIISAKTASLDPKMAGKLLFVSENLNWHANKMDMNEIVDGVDSEDEIDEGRK